MSHHFYDISSTTECHIALMMRYHAGSNLNEPAQRIRKVSSSSIKKPIISAEALGRVSGCFGSRRSRFKASLRREERRSLMVDREKR